MKLITFGVPAYNSQDYLEKCVNSLVVGGDEVEIIIVNDGSTDRTEEIALAFKEKYPNIVKVISKENGSHGSGVMAALNSATGLYYKVVDSDDWLEEKALLKFLDILRNHLEKNDLADLYITNFIYDKVSLNKFYIRQFTRHFPQEKMISWSKVGKFYGAQVLLMHSLTYNTKKLIESSIDLPNHTFYVDNIYAYKPLPHMNKIYYIDLNLYHYFIGREDQSVNLKVFTKRYDQQIRVMKEMITAYTFNDIKNMSKGLSRYMLHDLAAIMMTTILFTVAEDDDDRRVALKELWLFIKNYDYDMYKFLRWQSMPMIVNSLPWRLRGKVMVTGYKYLRRRLKLG
ncbi:MAG: glycosyltransferase family A protein [Candidatus Izemoplasmatales bacterium]